MFTIKLKTGRCAPGQKVVVRGSADGWAFDHPGRYDDGAWVFELEEDDCRSGLDFKFVIPPNWWMVGDNLHLDSPADGDAKVFDECQVRFPDGAVAAGAREDVWDRLKEAGEFERHFNQLQAGYRTLASTWLLATFAGVGFTLINNKIIPEHRWLALAAGICFLGAIGILLVWVMDILVYNQLLNAVFFTARGLEVWRYGRGDAFRAAIVDLVRPGGVTKNVRWFYLCATNVLLLIAAGAGAVFSWQVSWPIAGTVAIAAVGVVLSAVAAVFIWKRTEACTIRVYGQFPEVAPKK